MTSELLRSTLYYICFSSHHTTHKMIVHFQCGIRGTLYSLLRQRVGLVRYHLLPNTMFGQVERGLSPTNKDLGWTWVTNIRAHG